MQTSMPEATYASIDASAPMLSKLHKPYFNLSSTNTLRLVASSHVKQKSPHAADFFGLSGNLVGVSINLSKSEEEELFIGNAS